MEETYQKLCNYEFVDCAAFALWTGALERRGHKFFPQLLVIKPSCRSILIAPVLNEILT